ncbi:GntR family transcriptional regulator [Virgibacillus profundi]|uniref:GntR family transcriptional regulator n=1 Tax=Virgibacillus profundi TaxID=2024555 RepID=A0A2A2IGL7_9BACI|nr:GntR family transcriptional regulator [Virgibacillus profundi]PAV31141.1 GntR family transcriptional regulator [Virgibacillus profundi]PXY55324.1 GntR family transcriptional regulator [Virgibacillus profundi]
MDKKNRVPLYLQLMEDLIKKIDSGKFRENEKLNSERELCEIYNMSRITVRQALQELKREGYIYKLHGKGTFVAPKSINQNLVKLYSFTEEMKKMGKTPTTEVLSFKQITVDEHLASKMEVDPYEEAFQVVRLRLADKEALLYETSYLPKKIFPKLKETDLNKRPMYDIFYQDYQVSVTKAIERFAATSVGEAEANHLNMQINQPAMLIRRHAYHQDQLIEYTVSVARGDKFDYTVELT